MKGTICLLLIITCHNLFSQEFQGIATYRSIQQVSVKLDSTKVNVARAKEINDLLKSNLDYEYQLQFDIKESLYKKKEKLQLDQPKLAGSKTYFINQPGQSPLYKNIATATYVKEEDIMGKIFLVKDKLSRPDWKIESQQKLIGNYTVFKATWTRDIETTVWDNTEGFSKITVPKITIAWYAPDIPVSHGPGEYWGLPGLIMEIQEEKSNLLLTEIILNPQHRFSIEAPRNGKPVDQASFNRLNEEKTGEMIEKMGKSREGGTKIKVRN